MVSSEITSIKALCGKDDLTITVLHNSESVPTDCIVHVVSTQVAVFLEVQGLFNADLEIRKAQAQIEKAVDLASKLKTIIDASDFQKSSQAVQEMEKKRLTDLLAEQNIYEKYVKQYEQMRREN